MQAYPFEIIQEIATHLDFKDYISLSSISKAIKSLSSPQNIKRYLYQKFDSDSNIMLLFLLRHADSSKLSEVFDCFLRTPGSLYLSKLDSVYYQRISLIGNQNQKKSFISAVTSQNNGKENLSDFYRQMFNCAFKLGDTETLEYLVQEFQVPLMSLKQDWFYSLSCNKMDRMISFLILNDAELPHSLLPVLEYLTNIRAYKEIFYILSKLPRDGETFQSCIKYLWYVSISEGHKEILMELLHKFRVPPNFQGNLALRWSIRTEDPEILNQLMASGLQIEQVELENALYMCVRRNFSGHVKVLLSYRYKVDSGSLHAAIQSENEEIVRMLLASITSLSVLEDSCFDGIRVAKQLRNEYLYNLLLKTAETYLVDTKTVQRRFINNSAHLQILPGVSNRTYL